MNEKFANILKPIQISNTLRLKNRIVMAPMDCNFASISGEVTEKMIEHYEKRAKNQVGLIIIEATSIDQTKKNLVCQPVIANDTYIPGFANLAERIHAWNAKTFVQIMHPGNESAIGRLVSSSNVPSRIIGGDPKPLTLDEIEEIIDSFIMAANRVKIAGFDGVEIHAAHGYLLNQFLSPFYNRRTDSYGGSLENRARICINIIKKIKETHGRNFSVGIRYSADEYIDSGLKIAESKKLAKLFEEAGADILHISGGIYDSLMFISGTSAMPQGMHSHLAKEIKAIVKIPVITVGRINDPMIGEKLLRDNSADLIAFGRAFLADPKFPKKIYENRYDEIRKCIGCKYCLGRTHHGLDVRCAVNPETGRESIFDTEKFSRI